MRNHLAHTLRGLGTVHVDVHRPARLDPAVPVEETAGAIAEQVGKGHVRHIGPSEVGAETLRRAHAVHPIADLRIEYSPISRGIERSILPTAREPGIGITAYGVLSRGPISGHWTPSRGTGDFRAVSPRFQGDNLRHNLSPVEELRAVASSRGVSVAQSAIAWVLARGDDVVPLVGARRRARPTEAPGAPEVTLPADDLTADDLAAIEPAVPPGAAAGHRCADARMAHPDSER